MFMLVTTMCLQLSQTDPECRVEVQGVYAEADRCRMRMDGHQRAILAVAAVYYRKF